MSDDRQDGPGPSDEDRSEDLEKETLLAAPSGHHEPSVAKATDALALAALADAEKRTAQLRSVHDDRYGSFRVLGQGGMGIVYWALDTDLNRQVAFKVIRPDVGLSGVRRPPDNPITMQSPGQATPVSQAFETLKARFLQEAWVTAGLEHPGIVPVYELGQTPEGVPYYTMRFVRGNRTLSKAILDVAGKPMEERLQLLDAFLRVCDTVRYAHAHGVVHRDLKPENIVIGEFGEVVVLDWGLAKMQGAPDAAADAWRERLHEFRVEANLHTVASAMGTPGYMSPEAAEARVDDVDERSDVYSLGAILYEVATGVLPHEFVTYGDLLRQLREAPDPDPSTVEAATPAPLAQICCQALAKDRERRTASVHMLATQIRGWLAQREADRQLDALRRQASTALDAARGLTGDLRLHQLDKAASLCTQALEKSQGDAEASALRGEIDVLRAQGVAEREHAARARTLRRAGVAALVVAVAAGAVVAKVLDDQRQAAEDARDRAQQAEEATAAALVRVSEERDAKAAALRRIGALALASASAAEERENTTLALLLAREGVRADVTHQTLGRLQDALSAARERWTSEPLPEQIVFAEPSPDGSRVVVACIDGSLTVLDGATGRVIRQSAGRAEMWLGAAWRADGAEVLLLSDRGAVILDAGGEAIQTLAPFEAEDTSAIESFAQQRAEAGVSEPGLYMDENLVICAVASSGAVVSRSDGAPIRRVRASDHVIDTTVVTSPPGLMCLETDGKVFVHLAGEAEPRNLLPAQAACRTVRCAPSGELVSRLGRRRSTLARVAGSVRSRALPGDKDGYRTVLFLPRGRVLMVPDRERVLIADRDPANDVSLPFEDEDISSVAASQDGSTIVTGHVSGRMRLYDADRALRAEVAAATAPVAGVTITNDGTSVVSHGGYFFGRLDKRVRRWTIDPRGERGAVGSVGSAPPDVGGHVFCTKTLASATLHDVEGPVVTVEVDWPTIVVASRDGRFFLVGRTDGSAQLLDRTGTEVFGVKGHERNVVGAAVLTRDGAPHRVITASMDGSVAVWDARGRQLEEHSARDEAGTPSSLHVEPDGRLVVRVAQTWREWTGAAWGELSAPILAQRAAAAEVGSGAAPLRGTGLLAGNRLVVLDGDGHVRVLGADGGFASREASTAGEVELAVAPERIAVSGEDGTVHVLDGELRTVMRFRATTGWVHGLWFLDGGRRLLVSATDGSRVWRTDAAGLLSLAGARAARDLTTAERARFAHLLPSD